MNKIITCKMARNLEELRKCGFLTQMLTDKDLEGKTEKELIELGLLTQIGVFDGIDETEEEILAPEVEVKDEPEVESEVEVKDAIRRREE